MATVQISEPAIEKLLMTLPASALEKAPPTNLPTSLPLAFPTELHHINFLSTLHLVANTFAQPKHRVYFAEQNQDVGETALRGVLGMFLASDQEWDKANLLSAPAWAAGELGEAQVAEFFGIETHHERDHESMPGIRVGEKYQPAIDLVGELATLFRAIGSSLSGPCLGDEVVNLTLVASQKAEGQSDAGYAFAKEFCDNATSLIPNLKDPYPDPPGQVLPAGPLRLVQDLAFQFPNSDTIKLPPASALANISPLPLPLDILLHSGILVPEGDAGKELSTSTAEWWSGKNAEQDLYKDRDPKDFTPVRKPKIIKINSALLDSLSTASVVACRDLTERARAGAGSASSADDEWKQKLSEWDVARILGWLGTRLDMHGLGIRIVV